MTPERLAEIERDHVEQYSHTWMAHSAHPKPCAICDLLTALREAQNQSAFWEHEYNLAKDSRGERDALQRRVEALERELQSRKR